jgi:hypothetical protein
LEAESPKPGIPIYSASAEVRASWRKMVGVLVEEITGDRKPESGEEPSCSFCNSSQTGEFTP